MLAFAPALFKGEGNLVKKGIKVKTKPWRTPTERQITPSSARSFLRGHLVMSDEGFVRQIDNAVTAYKSVIHCSMRYIINWSFATNFRYWF